MAIIKNSRSLLNKDEEDEKKRRELESAGYFALPTLEEQIAIEEKAKEDAAEAASSVVRNNIGASDLGRKFAAYATDQIAERATEIESEKQKKAERIDGMKRELEAMEREYESYPILYRLWIEADPAKNGVRQRDIDVLRSQYEKATMTPEEYENRDADLRGALNTFAQSAGYGVAKSFGSVVDTTKAIGSGLAAGFQNMDDFKASYNRAYQKSLTDGTSLYDEIDADYQRKREEARNIYGKLNVFESYVDQAAHAGGEMAYIAWAASMAGGLVGSKWAVAAATKVDDMIAGGGKIAKIVGMLLKKVKPEVIGGGTAMFVTSSARSTKEAVEDMRGQNAGAVAFGKEPKYTEDEIIERAATFGVLNGLSESVLEYAIGGLTGMKGASKAIKNPLLTALGNYVKGAVGEGVEEIVQSLAAYGLKRATYDEGAELDWREVIDSGIVGTIMGFGMGFPTAVQNTRAAVDAQTTIHKIAKDANAAQTGIDKTKVVFEAESVVKSSEAFAKKIRETNSEGAEAIASVYDWMAKQARSIVDAMEKNAETDSAEGTGEAKRIWDDNNTEHIEIERTGRESGAADDDIRMAGEFSDILGKKIRFYREEAKGGTIRNGEYHEDTDTIYINAASKNVKSQIVAHELTHSIEKAGAYKSLVDMVFEKLRAEGEDIDALYRKKEMLYAKADAKLGSYEEITTEIVAEFVEKRLLTDAKSIKSLVQENRTLGQKIKEWFDSLLAKMGNANAQSREYLRKMRDLYAQALGENKSAERDQSTVKHSFTGLNENGIEVYQTSPETMALSWNDRKKKYLDLMRNDYQGRTAKFVRNGHVYYAQFDPNSLRKPIYGDKRSTQNGVKAIIKAGADGDIFELVESSRYTGSAANRKNHTNADYFDYYIKTVQIDGKVFDLMADVEKNNNVDGGYVYTLALVDNNKIKASPAHGTPTVPVNNAGNASGNIVTQGNGNVKGNGTISELGMEEISPESRIERGAGRKYSVSADTEGRPLSDAQKEYFKDSKVVDENGNLKVMYHGTQGGEFTVFDKKKAKSSGTFGRGFYFSDSKTHAGQYGNTFEVYLNIENPLQGGTKTMTKDQIRSFVEAVAENEDYGLDNYGYEATVDSVVNSLYGKSDFEIMMDVNLTCIGNMAEALELFNEVNGTAYDGIITPMETVVFKPEQIKNVDNPNPTSNPDIRYSVSEATEQEYTNAIEQGDMETAERLVRDAAAAAGYTEELYHGTQKFGFTKPDTKYSDDNLSFFATPDDVTVQTYSGTFEVREIKDGADEQGRGNYRLFANTDGMLDIDGKGGLWKYLSKTLISDPRIKRWYEKDKAKTEKAIKREREKSHKREAEIEKALSGLNREYRAAFDALIKDKTESNNELVKNLKQQIESLEAEKEHLNTKLWNLATEESRVALGNLKTRDVARFAKHAGYKGVIIRNIFDDGGSGNTRQKKPADIYNFFYPEKQLKSADTVVYDDNGNVIPLSERFDTRKKDIRWSVSEAGDDGIPMPSDADAPIAKERGAEVDNSDGYAFAIPEEFGDASMTYSEAAVGATPNQHDYEYEQKNKGSKAEHEFTREYAVGRRDERSQKRAERKTVAKAETAIKRLGYDIAGAIVDNYEDASGIIEDDRLAAQAESDIERYISANNVSLRADMAAKLIAKRASEPEELGLKGHELEIAAELATLYAQQQEISRNNVQAHGREVTSAVNDELDGIFDGYDWFSEKGRKAKRLGSQLQLNLSNPEQVMRDAFGEAYTISDGEGGTKTVNVAEQLNDYIIRPTIENSARARRQTNKQMKKLLDFGLSESESGLTQLFAEYSTTKESGSKKALLDKTMMRELLLGRISAWDAAKKIALKEGEMERSGKEGKNGFTKSITDVFENAQKVVKKRASERALRDFKSEGGTNAAWNALTKEQKQSKIDAAAETIADETVGRIEEAAKEMRLLLDDMFDAINAVSVIHGAKPIPFRRGYMPHSHRQTAEVQKWFNDHMGGINVTPVGDLPTDIAGKTADRKPNKRWMAHAQERTGPRTTWDALGNVADYLQIANDTIYHIDDIRKMRVLERYIRGIYSVARGATGTEQRTKVRNEVMQRLHGELDDDQLVFLGLKKKEMPVVSDEDMDLSQMTPFVTWLSNYANDLAAKQIFNRDIEAVAGRKYNNIANTITSLSSRVMMQYNISSNLKQLSQLGAVAGDVGDGNARQAMVLALRSMKDLGRGTNDLEQQYHISERSTFLAEKEAVLEASFASDHDLAEAQREKRDKAAEIWDYAWSFTDSMMSRFAVYSYFLDGMKRGMNDTDALAYADTKARGILASRMKGSSPLIFQSKNPILRLFTMFQREPLAAWEDALKTMPREYTEYKKANGDKAAKEWITKRVLGRMIGTALTNTAYVAIGLGTPAMFDVLGEPLRAIIEKVIGDMTEDEEDDQTWGETAENFFASLKDEIADDIPFVSLINIIVNALTGTEFESRLPLNAPNYKKLTVLFELAKEGIDISEKLAETTDADEIEKLHEMSTDVKSRAPIAFLNALFEIVGTVAPAGNQIRKSGTGLMAVLRGGDYTDSGNLKYAISGADIPRAILLGKSNTKAGQEWIDSGFDSYSKSETEAYRILTDAGVSRSDAAKYVRRVMDVEYDKEIDTKASAQARVIDRMDGLDDAQKAELYYAMVATDKQREAIDDAVSAGADMADAVETARAIRDGKKKHDKLVALEASDMDESGREAMYLSAVATEVKDDDGNVIGTADDDTLEALRDVGLSFDDFLDAKLKQSELNNDEYLSANQRAARFSAWASEEGYSKKQVDALAEEFGFASGFRADPTTYNKLVDGGVTTENAVKVSDALSGKVKAIDKINAIWSTGLTGKQLDNAIKAVVTDNWYKKYRTIIDANVTLETFTWVLENADQNGNGGISNDERTLILSQLALSRKELAALWEATGGSEKSNPYKSSSAASSAAPMIELPEINVPKAEIPDINVPKFNFDFDFGIGG